MDEALPHGPARCHLGQGLHHDILAHSQRQEHALPVAIRRNVDRAGLSGSVVVPQLHGSSGDVKGACRGPEACESPNELGLPVALHTGKADDLARLHGEVHVVKVLAGEVSNGELVFGDARYGRIRLVREDRVE